MKTVYIVEKIKLSDKITFNSLSCLKCYMHYVVFICPRVDVDMDNICIVHDLNVLDDV